MAAGRVDTRLHAAEPTIDWCYLDIKQSSVYWFGVCEKPIYRKLASGHPTFANVVRTGAEVEPGTPFLAGVQTFCRKRYCMHAKRRIKQMRPTYEYSGCFLGSEGYLLTTCC